MSKATYTTETWVKCDHLNTTYFTAKFWIFKKYYECCHDCKQVIPHPKPLNKKGKNV